MEDENNCLVSFANIVHDVILVPVFILAVGRFSVRKQRRGNFKITFLIGETSINVPSDFLILTYLIATLSENS